MLRHCNRLLYSCRIVSACVVIAIIASCGGGQKNTATAPSKLEIVRLDQDVAHYAVLDSADRDSVMAQYKRPLSFLFALTGRGDVDDVTMQEYANSRAVRVFTHVVDSLLPSLDSVESVLGVINDRIKMHLPKARIGDLYAIVSPYNQSIFTTDSVMLVGLNHYLGADFDGYTYFEPYQRVNKRIGQLPYDIVEAAIGSAYPMEHVGDMTVLNYLLYQGAVIEAKMQLVPDATLAEAFGYTYDQLSWLQQNESQAWNAMIERNLLYSRSLSDADRLILPSPATTILHYEAPGRAGRYIGYCIVKAYLDANPSTRLSDLFSSDFYTGEQTLQQSRYAPGRVSK